MCSGMGEFTVAVSFLLGLLGKVLKVSLLRVRWEYSLPDALITKNFLILCFRKLSLFF